MGQQIHSPWEGENIRKKKTQPRRKRRKGRKVPEKRRGSKSPLGQEKLNGPPRGVQTRSRGRIEGDKKRNQPWASVEDQVGTLRP